MPDSAASAPAEPSSLGLAGIPWTDVASDVTLLVPVGSVEQHGPHLPLDVDTVIAVATCMAAARRCGAETRESAETRASSSAPIRDSAHDLGRAHDHRGAVLVAPAVAYGASGEHEAFPGTVSVGTEALTGTLVEIGRSARRWAERVVFVNGHGGNVDALIQAVSILTAEGAAASWVACRSGEGHAGRAETSLLLHLAPERVRLDLAEPGNITPMTELLPLLRAGGVRAAAANGVLGDPGGASAVEGADILRRMTQDVIAHLADHRIAPTAS